MGTELYWRETEETRVITGFRDLIFRLAGCGKSPPAGELIYKSKRRLLSYTSSVGAAHATLRLLIGFHL
jgi:hypothetical protein